MEEVLENITQDGVLDVIKGFPVIPIRNKLIISVNNSEGDGANLDGTEFDSTQFVIAVGSRVTEGIVPGSRIILDLNRMLGTGEHGGMLQLTPVEVNGRVFAMINDSFVDAIDNR